VTEPATINLTYTPTLDEWEQRAQAWSRATGATRRRKAWGWVIIVLAGIGFGLALPALFDNVLEVGNLFVGVLLATYGIAMLTDVVGRWARRRQMRRSPSALLPSSAVVGADGVFLGTALASSNVDWGFWKSVLVSDDCLILATSDRWTANWAFLPRRGLQDPDQWDELVRLVTAHVPVHPSSTPQARG